MYSGGTSLRPGDAGYDPDADLSGSGSMGFFNYTAFTGRYGAYAPAARTPRSTRGGSTTVVCKTAPGQSGDLEPSRSGVHILGAAPFQAADLRS